MKELAESRGFCPNKYFKDLAQNKMSVFPPNEDIITVAYDAALRAVSKITDLDSIKMVIFATESSFDQSKSAALYIHKFLNLSKNCRVIEIKQACYCATAGLQIAKALILQDPTSKVLVIASDIARYKLNSSGEPTQGGGAVAMVISANPSIIAIENEFSVYTEEVMDFWHPIYTSEACLDGKLSIKSYFNALNYTFNDYCSKTNLTKNDFKACCYHTPFCMLAKKAHKKLFDSDDCNKEETLIYNREIGNSYSASLYIAFISLIDNSEKLENKRIGFFSYGSGSTGEFFSGIIQKDYRNFRFAQKHQKILKERNPILFEEYEAIHKNSENIKNDSYQNICDLKLSQIKDDKRIYLKL